MALKCLDAVLNLDCTAEASARARRAARVYRGVMSIRSEFGVFVASAAFEEPTAAFECIGTQLSADVAVDAASAAKTTSNKASSAAAVGSAGEADGDITAYVVHPTCFFLSLLLFLSFLLLFFTFLLLFFTLLLFFARE